MPHRKREERVVDLIDELLDHPEEEFLSGKMTRQWAEKCLDHEQEERIAVVAFLKHAQAPKVIIDMIERGDHRKRSTLVMKALKAAGPELLEDRKKAVERLVREYVGNDNGKESGTHRKFESCGGARRR